MSHYDSVLVGDLVAVDLRASHGGDVHDMVVIGEMAYSTPADRVWLLADETAVGMPVGAHAITVVARGHDLPGASWRARYERLFPGQMKPHGRPHG